MFLGSFEEGGYHNPQGLQNSYKLELYPESIHGVRGNYLRHEVLDTTISTFEHHRSPYVFRFTKNGKGE